jgi:predicted CoA-substrate-specific enzyme activase
MALTRSTQAHAGVEKAMSAHIEVFLGIDVGSTTVKAVVLNGADELLFASYRRHLSEVRSTVRALLFEVDEAFPGTDWKIAFTGSGAIALAGELGVPFVQEVAASTLSIRSRFPDADVAIELGGEDAKLTFFTGGADQRMNETCAGGTGAFIDQMASFMSTDAAGLDQLALRHKTLYPIASRCGVFSKTDIVPLLNEGCAREDIAASIMQAVVNQTISGLARGRPISGRVVFLGGPLAFLRSLRERFAHTLKLDAAHAIFPAHAEYFVALGAALYACQNAVAPQSLAPLLTMLGMREAAGETTHLPPLFADEDALRQFRARHERDTLATFPLEDHDGDAWLGFDSGSTTIKVALIDGQGRLLYSSYGSHKADPLGAALSVLREIYSRRKPGLRIRATAVTGYGSGLLTAALRADIDEVETVAHYVGAKFFDPEASFILDIGGQDIKCLRIRGGAVDRIQLNEACSAGCGSFIENFADSLDMPLDRFVEAALAAKNPVDLGTRCTVFMNSKVRQAQKDGVDVGDIAAGLSYSVIRNACYKVIKIADPAELGDHVVAQGGSFANDAILRALELQIGRTVVRPGMPGLMGAFGAALIARERGPAALASDGAPMSLLIGPDEAASFTANAAPARCRHCSNNCRLTITTFADSRRFISGNRCERGADSTPGDLPNLYAWKNQRLFETYIPLPPERATRGTIGIPRCLNIYENYPLWFTLFTTLGFRVELSSPSSREVFFRGYGTIPSQTVCYPAKLAHGHILNLLDRKVDCIFYPCIQHELREFKSQDGTYNCPVVIGYPELLARNITELQEAGIPFIHRFLPLDREFLGKRLSGIEQFTGILEDEMEHAVRRGFLELDRYREDVRKAGENALNKLEAAGSFGVILAGHPYHVDPEVHHGIAELIASCGLGVLTEDSVAHLMPDPGLLRVVDQWTYHARLYRAGAFAAAMSHLAVLQLVSFGCGLDAITSDQLEEIVTRQGRLYAQIKIDEGANLGPARIRIRSLLAALRDRKNRQASPSPATIYKGSPPYTEAMRKTHTILIPQLSPIHFQFVAPVFRAEGYLAEQLPKVDREAVELGLRHVNNDACFPAIVVVGQLMQAVRSGRYDLDRLALMISQTGGGCRATNYIGFLRKALADCGLDHVPVISFNMMGLEKNPGFKLSARLLRRGIMACIYGDVLMRMLLRVAPYEAEPGSADRLAAAWIERGKETVTSASFFRYNREIRNMIKEFDNLPLRTETRRPRVGLVGEILLKYHPDANNMAAKVVEQEGGEAVVSDLMDFVLYSCYDGVYNYLHLAGGLKVAAVSLLGIGFMEFFRAGVARELRRSKRFTAPHSLRELRRKAQRFISLGHQTGEGWLLVAEMVEHLESGVHNILCMQPFGCLPNHITGKGVLKQLKQFFPHANIAAIDYDPGASEVNQINRIKLMMSVAKA